MSTTGRQSIVRGTFSIDQNLTIGATHTQTVTLPSAAFARGYVVFSVPSAAARDAAKRAACFAVFGRALNDAASHASGPWVHDGFIYSLVLTYYFIDLRTHAHRYERDGQLSTLNAFSADGPTGYFNSLGIELLSVQIVGATIEFKWKNFDSTTRRLYVDGEWRAFVA